MRKKFCSQGYERGEREIEQFSFFPAVMKFKFSDLGFAMKHNTYLAIYIEIMENYLKNSIFCNAYYDPSRNNLCTFDALSNKKW